MQSLTAQFIQGRDYLLLCTPRTRTRRRRLALDVRAVGVAAAGGVKVVDEVVDGLELLGGELDEPGVLPHALDGGGPGDGDHLGQVRARAEGPDPVDGQLGGGAALLGGEGLDLVDELEVVLQGVADEAGELAQPAEMLRVRRLPELAGEDLFLGF